MTLAILADSSNFGTYVLWWAAQVAAVAILVILVVRWRPGFLGGKTIGTTMGSALDSRAAQIQTQLEAAERSREEAARIQAQAQADIEHAHSEAEAIVSRAQETAASIQHEMEARAKAEYERIVGHAKDEIEYERRQAELALRRRAADIVVDAARQVVQQNLTAEADRRIIGDSLVDVRDRAR